MSRVLCEDLCTGGVPLQKHPLQHPLHLGKTLKPPLLPLRSRYKSLYTASSLGNLWSLTFVPCRISRMNLSIRLVLCKYDHSFLGHPVEVQEGPRVLHSKPHHPRYRDPQAAFTSSRARRASP